MMPTSVIIFLCLILVSFIAFIILRIKVGAPIAIVVKGITSVIFIVIGLLSILKSPYPMLGNILIIIGLIFGLLGDVLLDIKYFYSNVDQLMLNLGFLAFGIGHICYIGAMTIYAGFLGIDSFLWPCIIGLIGDVVICLLNLLNTKVCHLNMKGNFIQSAAYLFILGFTTVFSICLAVINSHFIIMAVAMSLFLFSDVILSYMYFGKWRTNNIFMIINHFAYYAAQVLIALMILGI